MKLMTEMQDGCVHASDYCVDEECVDSSEVERLVHDAAAAHAMMQAMDWVSSNGIGCDPYEVPDFIRERADEIMREWGYAEGSN